MFTKLLRAWHLYGNVMCPEARRWFDEINLFGPTDERVKSFTSALGVPESEDSLPLTLDPEDDMYAMRAELVRFTDEVLLSGWAEVWKPPVLGEWKDAPAIDQENWKRLSAMVPLLF